MITWLFIFLLIAVFCFIHNFKWTKQEIADSYGICRKTLNKWVKYCCPNIDSSFWIQRRKFNVLELIFISFELGNPEQHKSLSKGDIIIKSQTLYNTVRENVAINFEKLGLSTTAYKSIDIFPPKLSERIVIMLG